VNNGDPELQPAADAEARAYRRLASVDTRIRNEHDYVSTRTSWLFASHAFLFVALTTLLNQPATGLPRLRVIRTVMMIVLPLIGVISSYLIWQAIRAAYHVLRLHRDLRRELENVLVRQFHYSVADPEEEYLKAGDRPPVLLPLLLGTVWLLLLVLISADVLETLIHYGVFAIARGA